MNHNIHLLSFLNDLYDREPPRQRFVATSQAEWRTWREAARKKLEELLTFETIGRLAWRQAPESLVTEHVEEPDHLRERVLIPTLEGLWLPCFVLVPRSPPPYAAVLCLHGHGMSKDILAGVPRDDRERQLVTQHRGDYALKFVRAGFLALAPDAAGYGERTEEGSEGLNPSPCQHLFVNALSLGISLQGLRVWEFLRALDYLAARPDAQSARLAVAGLSMGCEHAMYVAALDRRLKAAVLSCCLRAIIPDAKKISWCTCLFSPGLFSFLDWPDIGALIAPCPAQLQFGDRDYVPLNLARDAHAVMQRAYALSKAPAGALEYDEFAGVHEFHFEAALPFVRRWLAVSAGKK
jgi:dienelactone hydrolase